MTEVAAPKYTVDDLAKLMGIKPASARVALRKAEIAKPGKVYGWNNQDDMKAVAAKLKSAPAQKKAPAAKKAPAKKPAAKKAE